MDRQSGAGRALGVVFQRDRIAEQHHEPVARLADHLVPGPLAEASAHFRHRRRRPLEVGAKQVAPLLRVELRGNPGRIHEIAEHHRDMTVVAGGFGRGRSGRLWERVDWRRWWLALQRCRCCRRG